MLIAGEISRYEVVHGSKKLAIMPNIEQKVRPNNSQSDSVTDTFGMIWPNSFADQLIAPSKPQRRILPGHILFGSERVVLASLPA
jgi:hypothetical protein